MGAKILTGPSKNKRRAWRQVCRAKAEGALGVCDLVTQNECLLLKMLHRLHASPRSRWASWVWASTGGHSLLLRGEWALGEHRASIVWLLPLYRSLTTVDVGDGRCCSFWWDCWLPCGSLASVFPALLSHAVDDEVTVWQVRQLGLASFLVPRLTTVGARELRVVHRMLDEAPRGRATTSVFWYMQGRVGGLCPPARSTPSCGLVG